MTECTLTVYHRFMNIIITATEARTNFFDLLNRVLYAGETVFISKAGVDTIAKVERVDNSVSILAKLAGSVSESDAESMKKTIAKARKYSKRPTASL